MGIRSLTREGKRQHVVQPARKPGRSPTHPTGLGLVSRFLSRPALTGATELLTLQRWVGNRAVTGLIQAKLTIGPPGDRYEQEADRVAEQVVSSRWSATNSQAGVQRQEEPEEEVQMQPLAATITPLVQRQEEEEEELQAKSQFSIPNSQFPIPVQRQEEEEEEVQAKSQFSIPNAQFPIPVQRQEEEEEEVQAKRQFPVPNAQFPNLQASGELEGRLASQRGKGQPLPDEVRAFMEPRFGADFSGVRVHTDGEATQLNRALNAKAFTHGQDIYFKSGEYNPGTPAGQRLLAHELTHTIQQTGGVQRISRWMAKGHKQITRDALAQIDPAHKKFSKYAQSLLAGRAGDLDLRVKPLSSIIGGRIAGFFRKKWSKLTYSSLQELLDDFEANRYHMRLKGEMSNHGEAGRYKELGKAGENAARVKQHVDGAVMAANHGDIHEALGILADALHATEDRGSHGEGDPYKGHDPRLLMPKKLVRQENGYYALVNNPFYRKGWNPDDLEKNSSGRTKATFLAMDVLNNFHSRLNKEAKQNLQKFSRRWGARSVSRKLRFLGHWFGIGVHPKEDLYSSYKKTCWGAFNAFKTILWSREKRIRDAQSCYAEETGRFVGEDRVTVGRAIKDAYRQVFREELPVP